MSSDELKRTMAFIVEQQAQFSADIQVLKERQETFQKGQETFQQEQARTHEDVVLLRETANTALEIASRAAEAVTKLAEAQTKTDRQLRRLARLFEAHVRDAHQHDRPTS